MTTVPYDCVDLAAVSLEDVLITDKLNSRPERPSDHAAENREISRLIDAASDLSANLLQKVADAALKLSRADSAGISILQPGTGPGIVRWHAVAGQLASKVGDAMTLERSPCCVVMNRDAPILFSCPERHFRYGKAIDPQIFEALLVPIRYGGSPVGALWIIAHTPARRFESEDRRLLESLAGFVSIACRMANTPHSRQAWESQHAAEAMALARLNQLSSRLRGIRDLREGLDLLLAATMDLLGADKGHIQLLDSRREVLSIAARRGFDRAFLDDFREVSARDVSARGLALRSGQRTIIGEVDTDEPFLPLFSVASAAGFGAVQSTPLIGRDGVLSGMISTHFQQTHRPGNYEPRIFDMYARLAADFIERCREEAALKTSEEQFQAVVKASSEIVYRMSPDWTEVRHLFGGNFDADTHEPSRNRQRKYIYPDDMPQVTAVIEQAMRVRSAFELEHRGLRADGSPGWALSRMIPIFAESGEIVEWLGVASDVTARKQAEEALRNCELRYRFLVAATSAVSWSCLPSGVQKKPQPSWMAFTGQSADEMLGTGWTDAVHPGDRADVARRWCDSIRQGVAFRSEHRIRRHDGLWRWMSAFGVPIRDSDDRIIEWIGINLDDTDRKLAEENLSRSQRMLAASQRIGRIGTWSWDIPSGNVEWSKELDLIHGLNPATYHTKFGSYLSFVHPEDRIRIGEEIRNVSSDGLGGDL